MSERRRLTRWPKVLECSFTWESRVYRGVVANLSYGGGRIQDVGVLPPPGSRLILGLELGGTEVTLKSRVIYSRGISIGIAFEESRGVLMKRLGPLLEDE
jgi:hypothetical protein